MKINPNLAGYLGLFTAGAAAVGILYTAFTTVMTDEDMDLHKTHEHAPLMESLHNIEASAVVQRIRGLHRSRCGGNFGPDLQLLLEQQVVRYKQLTGRDFRPGECRDGVWYTASGVPG